jgi:hypothetical protein
MSPLRARSHRHRHAHAATFICSAATRTAKGRERKHRTPRCMGPPGTSIRQHRSLLGARTPEHSSVTRCATIARRHTPDTISITYMSTAPERRFCGCLSQKECYAPAGIPERPSTRPLPHYYTRLVAVLAPGVYCLLSAIRRGDVLSQVHIAGIDTSLSPVVEKLEVKGILQWPMSILGIKARSTPKYLKR